MIQTLDFFTPVVDDPYLFGQIAAANSLSDVYAMGGEPKVALNIVCFPNCLDPEILGEILRGGADKVLEAGAVLVGGHSVQDDEPKYGLSVTGFVHPDKIYKNYGCQPGDVLVLTKQLGSGIVNTTVKAQMASEAAADEAAKVMASLNQRAKRAIEKHTIHACTDVTGFGLLGHCTEMAEASDMTLELYPEQIEYMTEAIAYARMGLVPAGAYKNREFAAEGLDYIALGEQTGKMAAQVLKGEKKAEEMNYETIKKPGFYVNKKVASNLGIKVPDELSKSAAESFNEITASKKTEK